MTLIGLLTQTATVKTAPGTTTDVRGNAQVDWSAAATATYPCRLEPMSSAEEGYDRYTEVAEMRLFLPPSAALTGRDRVAVSGVTYEVIGTPLVEQAPRGPHHIEAHLRVIAS